MLNPEVFENAARMVDAGWTQGDAIMGENKKPIAVCAVDAIAFTSRDSADNFYDYINFISNHIEEGSSIIVWEWNDSPERTKKEVVDVLRKCAELCE